MVAVGIIGGEEELPVEPAKVEMAAREERIVTDFPLEGISDLRVTANSLHNVSKSYSKST